MNDIQLGDTIKTYNEHYDDIREYRVLAIPTQPRTPWIVQELDNSKKWRLWTDGAMQINVTRNF